MAAASIANIVKSSLGPVGLDKMLVDDIGVRISVVLIALKRKDLKFFFFCKLFSSEPDIGKYIKDECVIIRISEFISLFLEISVGCNHYKRWCYHPEVTGGRTSCC